MRWFSKTENNYTPTRQSRRFRIAFLWLPLRVGDTWRWLETAAWWEYYGPTSYYQGDSDLGHDYRWIPYRWLNRRK